jgi:hypothetical protein
MSLDETKPFVVAHRELPSVGTQVYSVGHVRFRCSDSIAFCHAGVYCVHFFRPTSKIQMTETVLSYQTAIRTLTDNGGMFSMVPSKQLALRHRCKGSEGSGSITD